MTRFLYSGLFVLLVLGLFRPDSSQAQPSSLRGTGSIDFIVGVPMGEFRDTLDDTGFGLHLFAGISSRTSPLVVGLDLTFLTYGRSRRTVPFSQTVGPSVLVDVVTSNNIVQPHLTLRLQRPDGQVRPYVGVLGGFKYLFTETSVRDDEFRDERIAGSTNFDDFAWSGGMTGGVDIQVYREPEKNIRVSVHLGLQYVLGQTAEYLGEGELVDQNDDGVLSRDELDIRTSRTDLLQPMIGFSVGW